VQLTSGRVHLNVEYKSVRGFLSSKVLGRDGAEIQTVSWYVISRETMKNFVIIYIQGRTTAQATAQKSAPSLFRALPAYFSHRKCTSRVESARKWSRKSRRVSDDSRDTSLCALRTIKNYFRARGMSLGNTSKTRLLRRLLRRVVRHVVSRDLASSMSQSRVFSRRKYISYIEKRVKSVRECRTDPWTMLYRAYDKRVTIYIIDFREIPI